MVEELKAERLEVSVQIPFRFRGRQLACPRSAAQAVNVFANGTRLKPIKGNNWRKQDLALCC